MTNEIKSINEAYSTLEDDMNEFIDIDNSVESNKKYWNDMTNDERANSIINTFQYQIQAGFINYKDAENIKKQEEKGLATKGLFITKQDGADLKLNQAFNARTGQAYSSINSTMLDVSKHLNNYETNSWVGIEDLYGAIQTDKKEIQTKTGDFKGLVFENGKKDEEIQRLESALKDQAIPVVKIAYLKTYDFKRVIKKDENGNPIQAKDKDGNLKHFMKDGKPLLTKDGNLIPQYECEMEEQRDKDGNIKMITKDKEGNSIPVEEQKPFLKYKLERVKLEKPVLQTKRLINISEVQGLRKEFLPELDRKSVNPFYDMKMIVDENKQIDLSLQELSNNGKLPLSETQKVIVKEYEKAKFQGTDYSYSMVKEKINTNTNMEAFAKADKIKQTQSQEPKLTPKVDEPTQTQTKSRGR